MAVKGYLARVKVSGDPVAMTGEATTNIVTNTVYQITNAAKRILPLNETITLKVGGVAVTTGFTLNRLTGKVTFDTAAVRTVTIDGKYLPVSTATEAKEFSVTLNADLLDSTRFVSGGYVEKTTGLKSAEGSVSELFNLDRYFENSLVTGNTVVVEVYPDGTNAIRMFSRITSVEISSEVSGLIESSISFESTGDANISYI